MRTHRPGAAFDNRARTFVVDFGVLAGKRGGRQIGVDYTVNLTIWRFFQTLLLRYPSAVDEHINVPNCGTGALFLISFDYLATFQDLSRVTQRTP